MRQLPNTHSCFVCGLANPIGLRLRFDTDGRIAQTRFIPRPEHVGFKGVIHGGLVATVLDEIMVWACVVATGRFAFSAEMQVRYLHPLVPRQEVIITGELVANRKNRLFEMRAEARDDAGTVFATATGKYMPIPVERLVDMKTDLTQDADWLLSPRLENPQ